MAVLKSLSTLILAGSIIKEDETFECPESLATSLLDRGFATLVKEAQAVTHSELAQPEAVSEPETVSEIEEIRAEYKRMNVSELIELAKANGVDVKGLNKKGEIIEALIKFELGE